MQRRDGAYACAIAATELVLGLYAVRRTDTAQEQISTSHPLNLTLL